MDSSTEQPRGRRRRKPPSAPGRLAKALSPRWRRILRGVLLFCLACGVLGTGAAVGFGLATWPHMPALASIEPKFTATSFIYDHEGTQITGLAGDENRVPVGLEEMSDPLIRAFISHEDDRFYTHRGFVLRAIMRAAYAIVTGGRFQGGSTITQQLARTAFLTMDRTPTRKIQELILAIQLERAYTKDEILELYLNGINLGHGAYGVEAASRNFFGHGADELDLAEAAMLAGITKSPGYLTPYRNMEGAKHQQQVVLNQMVRLGEISQAEADAAAAQEIVLPGLTDRREYPYPFFVDHVVDQLLNVHKLDPNTVYSGGLSIYTTLDTTIQAAAEEAIAAQAASADFPQPVTPEGADEPIGAECGLVVMENETGYLRAIVGGVEHTKALQFNHATQAKRQPGSAFKPIVAYTPAIDLGYAPSTVVDDAPAVWFTDDGRSWHPKNYGRRISFRGLVTFRTALERSINLPAAKVLSWVGIRTGIDYARRMGIDSLVTEGGISDVTPSLSLGALTHGVSPLELTRAYGVLGNRGVKVQPMAVLRVVDRSGRVLVDNVPRKEMVLSEQTAWLVTDALVGVIHKDHGTGWRARLTDGWVAAGKTGTSSDTADVWFAGYTSQYSAAVWLGYPKDRISLGRDSQGRDQIGGRIPALIWREAMLAAHADREPINFERPSGLVRVTVCSKSGKLPSPSCPPGDLITDYFVKGFEPKEQCDVHVTAQVCLDQPTHLACPSCPPDRVVWRTFIKRPEPYAPWVDSRGVAHYPADAGQEVPTEYCTLHEPPEPFVPDQIIPVRMSGYRFEPRLINVAQGSKIRLALTASGRTYGMAIDGYGVSAVCAPGQTVYLDFVADKAGTFGYYCHMDVGSSKNRMTGRLVVN